MLAKAGMVAGGSAASFGLEGGGSYNENLEAGVANPVARAISTMIALGLCGFALFARIRQDSAYLYLCSARNIPINSCDCRLMLVRRRFCEEQAIIRT